MPETYIEMFKYRKAVPILLLGMINVSNSEMIFKVYSAQKLSPDARDWVNVLEADKTLFNIKLSDKKIASIPKQKLKKFVKKKTGELTVQNLEKLKR